MFLYSERSQLKEIRETGFVISVDELHPGAVSIAAPIRDYTGEVVAALSLAGPTGRILVTIFPAVAGRFPVPSGIWGI